MSDDGGLTTDEGGISSDDGDIMSGAQVNGFLPLEELDSNDMECSYPYGLFLRHVVIAIWLSIQVSSL